MWPILILGGVFMGWWISQQQQKSASPQPQPQPSAPPVPQVVPTQPSVPIQPATPPSAPLNLPNLADVQSLPAPLTATWNAGSVTPANGVQVNVTISGGPAPIPGIPATLYALMADGNTAAVSLSSVPSIPGVTIPNKFWAQKA